MAVSGSILGSHFDVLGVSSTVDPLRDKVSRILWRAEAVDDSGSLTGDNVPIKVLDARFAGDTQAVRMTLVHPRLDLISKFLAAVNDRIRLYKKLFYKDGTSEEYLFLEMFVDTIRFDRGGHSGSMSLGLMLDFINISPKLVGLASSEVLDVSRNADGNQNWLLAQHLNIYPEDILQATLDLDDQGDADYLMTVEDVLYRTHEGGLQLIAIGTVV